MSIARQKPIRWLALQMKDILFDSSTVPIEVMLSIVTMSWGLWFLLHPLAFDRLNSYRVMAQLCDRVWIWAIIYGFTGNFRLLSVLTGNKRSRKILAFWCTMLWLYTTISLFLSNPVSVGVPTACVFAAASAWTYWRIPCRKCSQ